MNKKYFFLGTFVFLLFTISGCSLSEIHKDPAPKACTEEAKICPNGTTVGRTGPQCEFATCPIVENKNSIPRENEKIFTDPVENIRFLYVDPFPNQFITAQSWPPSVTISDEKFFCQEGGSQIQASGQTTKKVLGEKPYCLQMQSEGAAGSIYTTFTYTTVKNEKLITFRFVLRFVQCVNYDDPRKTDCTQEQDSFDPNALVLRMEQTLQLILVP